MDESRRDGGRRRRRPAVRRDRPAVPRRARRRRCRSSSSSTRSRRSPGPRVPPLHLRGTGRNDHHLAEAAFKALGARAARRVRAGPAADRRRVHEGLARMTTLGAAVRTSPWSTTARATSSRSSRRCSPRARAPVARSRPATLDGADLLVVPGRRGRGAGDGPAAGRRLRRPDPRPGSPPIARSSGSASGSSSCSRAATRTAQRRSACCAGRTVRLVDAPTLPHIGWNQVVRTPRRTPRSTASPTAPTSTSSIRTWARRRTATARPPLARDRPRAPVRVRRRARPAARRPVPPRALRAPTACG